MPRKTMRRVDPRDLSTMIEWIGFLDIPEESRQWARNNVLSGRRISFGDSHDSNERRTYHVIAIVDYDHAVCKYYMREFGDWIYEAIPLGMFAQWHSQGMVESRVMTANDSVVTAMAKYLQPLNKDDGTFVWTLKVYEIKDKFAYLAKRHLNPAGDYLGERADVKKILSDVSDFD